MLVKYIEQQGPEVARSREPLDIDICGTDLPSRVAGFEVSCNGGELPTVMNAHVTHFINIFYVILPESFKWMQPRWFLLIVVSSFVVIASIAVAIAGRTLRG